MARVKKDADTAIKGSDAYFKRTEIMENNARALYGECEEIKKKAAEDIKAMKVQVTETTARATEVENKLTHLEEDHKSRGAKIERLEKGENSQD